MSDNETAASNAILVTCWHTFVIAQTHRVPVEESFIASIIRAAFNNIDWPHRYKRNQEGDKGLRDALPLDKINMYIRVHRYLRR